MAARMSSLWISMAEMIDNLLGIFWLRRAQAVTIYGASYMSSAVAVRPAGAPAFGARERELAQLDARRRSL